MPDLKAVIVPVTPFQQNCLLLWDATTGQGTVFDPGGDFEQVMAAVRETGMTVEQILLTHGHLDRAGGAMPLQRLLAAEGQTVPVIGPDVRDKFLMDGIAKQAAGYGITGLENAEPGRWLSEGEQVTAAGTAFQVLHCPGHTPGHVVFVATSIDLAIVGDVLFRGSVGRTDFPDGDFETLAAGIREKLYTLPEDTIILPGHGPGTTVGREKRENPFVNG